MAWGTPYFIGDAGSAVTGTTEVITAGVTTAAGDAIIVGTALNSGAPGSVALSVADSQGNIYARTQVVPDTTGYQGSVFVATCSASGGQTTPLASGTDTITVTYGSSASAKTAYAIGVSGAAVGPAWQTVDQYAMNFATSSTAISATLPAQAASGEMVIMITNQHSTGTSLTFGSPLSQVGSSYEVASNQIVYAAAGVSTTAAATAYTATSNVSGKWDAIVLSLFPLGGGRVTGGPLVLRGASAVTSGSSQVTSLTTLSVPATAQVGDIVYVGVGSESSNATQRTFTISGGGVAAWTAMGVQPARAGTSSGYVSGQMFQGVVTTAGGGTLTLGCSSSEYMMAACACYGNPAAAPVDSYPTPASYGTYASVFSMPSGTTVAGGDWVLAFLIGNFAANSAGQISPPPGYAVLASSSGGDGQFIAVADSETALAAGSAFGGVPWTYGSVAVAFAFAVAMTPAAANRHPKWLMIRQALSAEEAEVSEGLYSM